MEKYDFCKAVERLMNDDSVVIGTFVTTTHGYMKCYEEILQQYKPPVQRIPYRKEHKNTATYNDADPSKNDAKLCSRNKLISGIKAHKIH